MQRTIDYEGGYLGAAAHWAAVAGFAALEAEFATYFAC